MKLNDISQSVTGGMDYSNLPEVGEKLLKKYSRIDFMPTLNKARKLSLNSKRMFSNDELGFSPLLVS